MANNSALPPISTQDASQGSEAVDNDGTAHPQVIEGEVPRDGVIPFFRNEIPVPGNPEGTEAQESSSQPPRLGQQSYNRPLNLRDPDFANDVRSWDYGSRQYPDAGTTTAASRSEGNVASSAQFPDVPPPSQIGPLSRGPNLAPLNTNVAATGGPPPVESGTGTHPSGHLPGYQRFGPVLELLANSAHREGGLTRVRARVRRFFDRGGNHVPEDGAMQENSGQAAGGGAVNTASIQPNESNVVATAPTQATQAEAANVSLPQSPQAGAEGSAPAQPPTGGVAQGTHLAVPESGAVQAPHAQGSRPRFLDLVDSHVPQAATVENAPDLPHPVPVIGEASDQAVRTTGTDETSDRASEATTTKHVIFREPEVDEENEAPDYSTGSDDSPVGANWTRWTQALANEADADVDEPDPGPARKKQRRQTPMNLDLAIDTGASGKASSSDSRPPAAADASEAQAGPSTKAVQKLSVAPTLPSITEESSPTAASAPSATPVTPSASVQAAVSDFASQAPQSYVPAVASDVVQLTSQAPPAGNGHPDGQVDGSVDPGATATEPKRSLCARIRQWILDIHLRLPDRNNFRPIPERERAIVERQRQQYTHILTPHFDGESDSVTQWRKREAQRAMRLEHARQLRDFRAGRLQPDPPADEQERQTSQDQDASITVMDRGDAVEMTSLQHENEPREDEQGAGSSDAAESSPKQTTVEEREVEDKDSD